MTSQDPVTSEREPTANDACRFCSVSADELLISEPLAYLRRDRFPLTPGHCLVIPRRHVVSLFDTTSEERAAIFALLDQAKAMIDAERRPDGYNIGINDGAAAGQTILHLHVHLIPRYLGDTTDPRGGVRWVFPDRARYWKA